MSAEDVYRQSFNLGLTLEPNGDRLLVYGENCPPEFADVLRQHKGELLAFLEARDANLTPDCAPWLHIARQVLSGEWDGCDGSTADSLIIGLEGVPHPLCHRALDHFR